MTLTLEQRNFIAILESKNIEGEHQIPYIKAQFNVNNEQAINIQTEYWKTIYEELKPDYRIAGQSTINKTTTDFLYQLGQYKTEGETTTTFDVATLLYRLTMLGLLITALVWIGKIILTGSMF